MKHVLLARNLIHSNRSAWIRDGDGGGVMVRKYDKYSGWIVEELMVRDGYDDGY